MAPERPSRTPGPAPILALVPSGLFRTSPAPLLIVDARSRRIVEANQAFATLVGRLTTELADGSLDEVDAAPSADIAEYLVATLAAQDDGAHRRTFLGWDGSEIPVEVRATPLERGSGTLVVLHVTDLSREERLDEEARGLRSRLLRAQRHETVGRIAPVLAHGFSNLLSVVVLTADSLRERLADDPEGIEELDVLTEVGFRARELTVDLASFVAGEPREPREISLNALVREMEELLRRSVREDVEVSIRLCEEPARVEVDPIRIRQLLLTLAVHAREAMPEGGHLLVSTHETEIGPEAREVGLSLPPGPYVVLGVSDTGIGMDEEERARAFEPLEAGPAEDPAALDLADVNRIVVESGGEIQLLSRPGAGTTFRIHLPRAADAPPRTTFGPRGTRVGGLPGGTEHILLVEDDDTVRWAAAQILEELGYTVTPAATPDAALLVHDDLWPERGPHPVDLVLTDVIMPGMSGIELARRLHTKREDVPVVFMSGYIEATGRETGVPAAMPYLPKPLERARLAYTIRRVLDARGSAEAPA